MDMYYAKAYMRERQDQAENRRLQKAVSQGRTHGLLLGPLLFLAAVGRRMTTRSNQMPAGSVINTTHSCAN